MIHSGDVCVGLRGDVIVPIDQGSLLSLRVTSHRHSSSPYELSSLPPRAKAIGPCRRPGSGDVLLAAGGTPIYNGSLQEAIESWQSEANSFVSASAYAFPLVHLGESVHDVRGFMIVRFEPMDIPLTFAVGKGARASGMDVRSEVADRQRQLIKKEKADHVVQLTDSIRDDKIFAKTKGINIRRDKVTEFPHKGRESERSEQTPFPESDADLRKTRLHDRPVTEVRKAAQAAQTAEVLLHSWARARAGGEKYEVVRATFADDKGPIGLSFDASQHVENTIVSQVEAGRPAAKAGIRVGDVLIEMQWVERDDDGRQTNRVVNATALTPSQVRVELKDAAYPRTFVFYRRADVRPNTLPEENRREVSAAKDKQGDGTVIRLLSPGIIKGEVAALPALWAPFPKNASCDARAVLALAEPADGCTGHLDRHNSAEQPTYALVSRGKCTFVEKARALEHNGAAASIVYNNVAGLVDMPKGGVRTDDIRGPVLMIDSAIGMMLSRVLKWKLVDDRATAWIGHKNECVHLTNDSAWMPPARSSAADHADTPITRGRLHLQCQSSRSVFEHVAATFGPFAPDVPFPIAIAAPPELCGLIGVERRLVSGAKTHLRSTLLTGRYGCGRAARWRLQLRRQSKHRPEAWSLCTHCDKHRPRS